MDPVFHPLIVRNRDEQQELAPVARGYQAFPHGRARSGHQDLRQSREPGTRRPTARRRCGRRMRCAIYGWPWATALTATRRRSNGFSRWRPICRLAGKDPGCAWPPESSRATLDLHCASGEVPVMTGPQDPAAAGHGRLRAGHADREQAIDTLKTAFVHGQLTKERTRRASGPGARRADLRRPGRGHRRHPAPPARSQVGVPGRPGPPPAARQGGRQVGRLPDHRGRRHVGLGSPRFGRRPLPRHPGRQSFL